jgi:hypothetical protein
MSSKPSCCVSPTSTVVVLARELTVDIRDACLNFREEELADREKRLVGG